MQMHQSWQDNSVRQTTQSVPFHPYCSFIDSYRELKIWNLDGKSLRQYLVTETGYEAIKEIALDINFSCNHPCLPFMLYCEENEIVAINENAHQVGLYSVITGMLIQHFPIVGILYQMELRNGFLYLLITTLLNVIVCSNIMS